MACAVAGCGAPGAQRLAKLPFRVAVLPVDVQYVRGAVEPEGAEADQGTRLALDPAALTQALRVGLKDRVFADARVVTGLEMPIDTTRAVGASHRAVGVGPIESDGANLVLDCQVRVVARVRTETNDRYWVNLLLWTLGGPATWWVPDLRYHFEARMFAALHELGPIQQGLATLASGQARLATAHAGVDHVDLDLTERAGGALLPYVGSIFVPAAFLAEDGEGVARELEAAVTAVLVDSLCEQVAESREEIGLGNLVTDIGLAPEYTLLKQGDRTLFAGTARLLARGSDRLAEYTVRYGGYTVHGVFGDGKVDELLGVTDGEILSYEFEAEFPADASGSFLAITCVAGGRDRARRSFCVPVAWCESKSATSGSRGPGPSVRED